MPHSERAAAAPRRVGTVALLMLLAVIAGLVWSARANVGPWAFRPPPLEECSIKPDPSTRKGGLTPRTAEIARGLKEQGWAISCWDEHAWNPSSDHPKGRACDVFPGRGGVRPTAAQKAKGDKLAAELLAGAPENNVKMLIWSGKIWTVSRKKEGWRRYDGGGVYDPKDIIGGHYDHVHISVY
ncbi:MAG: hypothetical protein ACRC0L_07470 [Angustibacter sp.]